MNSDKNIKHRTPVSPPFLGGKLIDIPIEALFNHLNLPALYRIGWGAGKAKEEKWAHYKRQFSHRLEKMKQDINDAKWISPAAAFGYWKCETSADTLIIHSLEKQGLQSPIRLPVPRQAFPPHRSLVDYFSPRQDDGLDIIAFQVVTMGNEVVERIRHLQSSGDTLEAYFTHGLAAQLTEAAASYMMAEIAAEVGFPTRKIKRFSWGYEPLPDLAQQIEILNLLDPEHHLNIYFTSAYQFIPEFTTAALLIMHPEAEYFRISKQKED